MTNFDEYDAFCESTDISSHDIWYYALGLAGEAGEVAEKIKKLYRDHHGVITDEFKMTLAKELGDVKWYTSRFCKVIGLSSEVVAKMNMIKLKERVVQNKIQGSGDDRELITQESPEG